MNTVRLLASVCIFLVLSPLASASTIAPGDLIITEVMANPAAASDTTGEWFELHNLTGNSLNLDGLTLSDSSSNLHVINNGGSLSIDPFGYLVLGRSSDKTVNGGYTPDYVYANFVLSNSSDQIIISSAGVEIVRLEYSTGFAVAGKSQELTGTVVGFALDNTNFTSSVNNFGDGDYGTPGQAGASSWKLDASPVPLPAAFWLFTSGVVWLIGIVKKRPALAQTSTTAYSIA